MRPRHGSNEWRQFRPQRYGKCTPAKRAMGWIQGKSSRADLQITEVPEKICFNNGIILAFSSNICLNEAQNIIVNKICKQDLTDLDES